MRDVIVAALIAGACVVGAFFAVGLGVVAFLAPIKFVLWLFS